MEKNGLLISAGTINKWFPSAKLKAYNVYMDPPRAFREKARGPWGPQRWSWGLGANYSSTQTAIWKKYSIARVQDSVMGMSLCLPSKPSGNVFSLKICTSSGLYVWSYLLSNNIKDVMGDASKMFFKGYYYQPELSLWSDQTEFPRRAVITNTNTALTNTSVKLLTGNNRDKTITFPDNRKPQVHTTAYSLPCMYCTSSGNN